MDSNKKIRRALYVSAALLILSAIALISHDQESTGTAMIVLGVILLWIATSKSLSDGDGESEPRKAPGRRQAAASAATDEKVSMRRCPSCGKKCEAEELELAREAGLGHRCLDCWTRKAGNLYGSYQNCVNKAQREGDGKFNAGGTDRSTSALAAKAGTFFGWKGYDPLPRAMLHFEENSPAGDEPEVRCPVCGRVRGAADLEYARRNGFGDVCLDCWVREAAGFYGHYRELLRRVLREHGLEPDPDRIGRFMTEPATGTGNYTDWNGEELLLYAVPVHGGEAVMSMSDGKSLCRIPTKRNVDGKELSDYGIEILALCAAQGVLYFLNAVGNVCSEEQGVARNHYPRYCAFSMMEEAKRLIQPLPWLLENVGEFYNVRHSERDDENPLSGAYVCVLDDYGHGYYYYFEERSFLFVDWWDTYRTVDCPPVTHTPLTKEEFMERLKWTDFGLFWFLYYVAARYDLKVIRGLNERRLLLGLQIVAAEPGDLPVPAPSGCDSNRESVRGRLEEGVLP